VFKNSLEPNAAQHCGIVRGSGGGSSNSGGGGGGGCGGGGGQLEPARIKSVVVVVVCSRTRWWPHEICHCPTLFLEDTVQYRPIYPCPSCLLPLDLLVTILHAFHIFHAPHIAFSYLLLLDLITNNIWWSTNYEAPC
jgi:hypothetical protein